MNDWIVETPSFEEDLMNNRIVMLNQNGINRVVEIIKEKDKEIERLNKDLGYITKLFAIEKEKNRQAIEELENIPINANGGDILESERKVYHILKGSEKE